MLSRNMGKYGPENPRIRTLFMLCLRYCPLINQKRIKFNLKELFCNLCILTKLGHKRRQVSKTYRKITLVLGPFKTIFDRFDLTEPEILHLHICCIFHNT